MKSKHTYAALATLCMILWGTCCFAGNIKWYSYENGMDIGKEKEKKIFLHFYADWCGYCKKMANETFKDSSVISYLNEQYIPIRVDTDKEKKLAAIYGVTGLPSTWLLTGKGDKISNLPGYIGPDMLIPTLENMQPKK